MLETQKNKEAYESLKPEVKISLLFIGSLIITCILSMILIPYTWTFLAAANQTLANINAVSIFFILLLVIFFGRKLSLDNTEYKFYADHIDYYEGFLTKNRKSIKYTNISNVEQRRSVVERMYGLGSVYIDTPGSSKKGHELTMRFLANSEQVCDYIVSLTQKNEV